MDSLTKENFWNELQEKYPEQMKVFIDWIDEYKKRVDWDLIFREGKHGSEYAQPTHYHQLPIAIQLGIFMQFQAELSSSALDEYNKIPEEIKMFFHNNFKY